jgi:hypothetical protein
MDKVYSDFKDWTLKISNKFDVEIVFKFGIIKINFEFLFNKNNYFFFQIFYFKILATSLLFTTFLWICTFFPIFFQKHLLNEVNSKPEKTWWLGRGVKSNYPMPSPNYVTFTSRKEMKAKSIITS